LNRNHRRTISVFKPTSDILSDISNNLAETLPVKKNSRTPTRTCTPTLSTKSLSADITSSQNDLPDKSKKRKKEFVRFHSHRLTTHSKNTSSTENSENRNRNTYPNDTSSTEEYSENRNINSSKPGEELSVSTQNDENISDIKKKYSDGEILELEEQFGELCALYDNLFPKKATTTTTANIPALGNYSEKDSLSYHLSEEISRSFESSPSKLSSRSQPSSKRLELLSDSESFEDSLQFGSNNHLIEAALETLPPLSLPDSSEDPYTSPFSLPTTTKLQPPDPLDFLKPKKHENLSHQPWVIIRAYEKRGGKKIRLPNSLRDLIQISGDKLGINPVCIREVSTEAEIEDISAIESNSVLWVMTEEDERKFCTNPQ